MNNFTDNCGSFDLFKGSNNIAVGNKMDALFKPKFLLYQTVFSN